MTLEQAVKSLNGWKDDPSGYVICKDDYLEEVAGEKQSYVVVSWNEYYKDADMGNFLTYVRGL